MPSARSRKVPALPEWRRQPRPCVPQSPPHPRNDPHAREKVKYNRSERLRAESTRRHSRKEMDRTAIVPFPYLSKTPHARNTPVSFSFPPLQSKPKLCSYLLFPIFLIITQIYLSLVPPSKLQQKNLTNMFRLRDFYLVPEVGLEPTRCCHRQILSLVRLPFRHSGMNRRIRIYHETCAVSIIFRRFQNFSRFRKARAVGLRPNERRERRVAAEDPIRVFFGIFRRDGFAGNPIACAVGGIF